MLCNSNRETDSGSFELKKKKKKQLKGERKKQEIIEETRKTHKTGIRADNDKIIKASSAAKRSGTYQFFFYILKIDTSMTSLKS